MSGETWTFFSNHTHVLVCIAQNADARVRDMADDVGITERAVMRILAELEEAGAITKERHGRRNHYAINATMPCRHPLERHCAIGAVLEALAQPQSDVA